jgi:asparagine synthase (glutamine-hydrolysing)
MSKTIVLFSGGKDSFYALHKTLEKERIEFIVSVQSPAGDTQLHAGPEANEDLRKAQLDLLDVPYKHIIIGSGENYLHELFVRLNEIVRENQITHLVTGDLWHPYTSGIGDMLASALGVKIIRPAKEACPSRSDDIKYMKEILSLGINPMIISVRESSLSSDFVGRIIDKALVQELALMAVDSAAEGGEYQSFVLSAPIMKGKIVIDDFEIKLADGKNGKEKFFRMHVKKFHVENK